MATKAEENVTKKKIINTSVKKMTIENLVIGFEIVITTSAKLRIVSVRINSSSILN